MLVEAGEGLVPVGARLETSVAENVNANRGHRRGNLADRISLGDAVCIQYRERLSRFSEDVEFREASGLPARRSSETYTANPMDSQEGTHR